MIEKFKKWSGSNTATAKCTRTIFHGVIGVIIANIDVMVGCVVLDPTARAVIVPLVMAILSPIQAAIGKTVEEAE